MNQRDLSFPSQHSMLLVEAAFKMMTDNLVVSDQYANSFEQLRHIACVSYLF